MFNELLGDCQEYKEETYLEVLDRYNGFGKGIYKKLQIELPNIFSNLKFYHAIKSTEKCVGYFPECEDSYAIFDDGVKTFIIQLDPLSEVLIVNNYEISIETGYWSPDEYTDVINFIKENFTN